MKDDTVVVSVTVNNTQVGPVKVPSSLLMLDFLHEYAHLTGTRLGCGQGICHACVIILDHEDGHSEEMRTCITPVSSLDGKKVRTIEGHAKYDDKGALINVSPVQQAFLDFYSFQCGYCTSGFVNAATVLVEKLEQSPIAPEQVESAISDALNDHICRCTGYVRYYQAVKHVITTTPGLITDKTS